MIIVPQDGDSQLYREGRQDGPENKEFNTAAGPEVWDGAHPFYTRPTEKPMENTFVELPLPPY